MPIRNAIALFLLIGGVTYSSISSLILQIQLANIAPKKIKANEVVVEYEAIYIAKMKKAVVMFREIPQIMGSDR